MFCDILSTAANAITLFIIIVTSCRLQAACSHRVAPASCTHCQFDCGENSLHIYYSRIISTGMIRQISWCTKKGTNTDKDALKIMTSDGYKEITGII